MMGYFKKRREAAEKKRLDALMNLFSIQAEAVNKSVYEGTLTAIGIFDKKKSEYENNMRENLEKILEYGDADKLVEEVANVIDKMSGVYGYRIAKGKRTELAQDILVALSVKK